MHMTYRHVFVVLGSILLTVTGCDKNESHGKAAGSAVPAGEPPKPAASATATASASAKPAADTGEPTALSCDEAESRGEELEGKPVLVTAISWGVGSLKTGGKRLELGARPLTGMRQAHLAADFQAADVAQLDALPKDAKVKLRCVMGPKQYGQRKLNDCKIIP